MKRIMMVGVAAVAALALSVMGVGAAVSTVRVLADGDGGWAFNADPNNVTPYEFTGDEASIGDGSLHVLPITNTVNGNGDKFTAALLLGNLVSDMTSVSYDFMVEGGGATAYQQFYLNIYTAYPAQQNWYDCRFDYVPSSGSTVSFTNVSIAAADTPTAVANNSGGCPATLAEMPAGSTVLFMVLNVGDTSANDTGVGGYYDNVVVTTSADTTTFDFDVDPPTPTSKNECKKGGWADFGFTNQGRCVSWVNLNT